MISRSSFREQVRQALSHLYDYERLHELALGGWLGALPGYTGRGTLHQLLLDAIEALKPQPGTPADATSWRTYQILFCRYTQGMPVGEAASQLGFGDRHFRRQQALAVRLLADWLWERYDVGNRQEPPAQPAGADDLSRQADLSANLAWMAGERAPQESDLHEVMAGVGEVLSRLLSAQGVRYALDLPADLPPLSIHPLAMRQVLANTLSCAVGLVPGGRIAVEARALKGAVRLCSVLQPASGCPLPAIAPASDALAISRQLLAMHKGSLELETAPAGALSIVIQVPASRRLPVLIVDDNTDTARLFARYLAESRYRPVIATSGREALALAPETLPSAILLDVMMPEQDGWEVLSLLKAHPQLDAIPIIVTTILTDRELALSLGAADFLHKPVSQQALLAALDRQVE